MAKIKKINVSQIEGENPGNGASILPAGVITVYEDTGDYFLRIHDGETDGGVAFAGGTTGNITFDGLNIIGQSTEGRFGLINLVPAETATGQFDTINYLDAGQYVSIYPTNEFDSPHIHIAAGLGVEGAEGDLFLGDDEKYVQVNHSGVVSIRSNDYQENNAYVWRFGNDGRLELPGGGELGLYGMGWTGLSNGVQGTPVNLAFLSNDEQNLRTELSSVYLDGNDSSAGVTINAGTLDVGYQWAFGSDGTTGFPNDVIKSSNDLTIRTLSGIPTAISNINSSGFWDQNPTTSLATTGGSGEGLTVTVTDFESGYAGTITIDTAGTGYTDGDTITVTSGNANATFAVGCEVHNWEFSTTGGLTFPDDTVQTTAYTGGGGTATGVSRSDDNLIIRLTDPNDDGLELRSIFVDGNDADVASTVLGSDGFIIRTNSNVSQKQWAFGSDGGLTFPDDTVQTTAWTGVASEGTTSTTSANVGYIGMPQNLKSSSYTLVAEDQGKHIYVTAASQTITVPANATTAFPVGTTIAIIAGPTANPVTISIASDTMHLAGSGSTGSRTLQAYGMATLVKVAETVWFINGSGLS
jgi:hypothetical protein